MKLTDLLSAPLLVDMLEQKYVKAQSHPTLPLVIYNYTDQAMWDKAWNDVTRQCRGLIANHDGDVVARPWEKFFNYGEYSGDIVPGRAAAPGTRSLDMHSEVHTTDKKDGSLGILYPTAQGHSIATRGSFTSEQAIRGSFIWYKKLYSEFSVPEGWTLLFEIVYPENRIVLDYAGLDDLILLGAREIETGRVVGPDDFLLIPWRGPRAEVFEDRTLVEALHRHPRPNAEGVVVRYVSGSDDGLMVKIKQDDYVLMHRLITGMNARSVWERLMADDTPADICQGIPEEFWPWVNNVAYHLLEMHAEVSGAAYREFSEIKSRLVHGWDRKAFAAEAVMSEYRPYLFMLLDGRDIAEPVWKTIKPSGEDSMKYTSEDVA